MATNKMQPTHNPNPRKVLISITGIDLTDMDSASASLLSRIATALKTKSIHEDEATANMPPTHSLNPREVLCIDITDINPGQEASALISLIPRLATTLVSMAEEEAMTPKESSLPHSKVEEPSEDGDSTFRGARHFLSSWQDDLDTFEGDSEIYEKDSDTSAATKSLQTSKQKQPSQGDKLHGSAPAVAVQKPQPFRIETAMQLSDATYYTRHARVKMFNMSVVISKADPIPEPMRAELCYASEEEEIRPASEEVVRHASGKEISHASNLPLVIPARIEPVSTALQGEIKYFFPEKDRPKLRRMKRGVSVSRMPM